MSAKAGICTWHLSHQNLPWRFGEIGNGFYLPVRLSIMVPRIVLTSCAWAICHTKRNYKWNIKKPIYFRIMGASLSFSRFHCHYQRFSYGHNVHAVHAWHPRCVCNGISNISNPISKWNPTQSGHILSSWHRSRNDDWSRYSGWSRKRGDCPYFNSRKIHAYLGSYVTSSLPTNGFSSVESE